METGLHHRPIVRDIANLMIKLRIRNKITVKIALIKAHSGIRGNDIADELAKSSVKSAIKSGRKPKCTVPVPFSVAKIEAKIAMLTKWQKQWTNSNRGRHLFTFCPEISDKPYQALALPRSDFGILARLMTGHIGLNDYLCRYHIMNVPTAI